MDHQIACSFFAVLVAFYLTPTNAETAIVPVEADQGNAPAAAQALDATLPIQTTAEIWNKSNGDILVSQKGRAQERVEKAQRYKSQSYPQVPINIQIPSENPIKYITLTGQSGACTVPVCIIVQSPPP